MFIDVVTHVWRVPYIRVSTYLREADDWDDWDDWSGSDAGEWGKRAESKAALTGVVHSLPLATSSTMR